TKCKLRFNLAHVIEKNRFPLWSFLQYRRRETRNIGNACRLLPL
ncbi:NMT1/THI5 like family protein, partial [Chlamydia psittaci 84-8471/1]